MLPPGVIRVNTTERQRGTNLNTRLEPVGKVALLLSLTPSFFVLDRLALAFSFFGGFLFGDFPKGKAREGILVSGAPVRVWLGHGNPFRGVGLPESHRGVSQRVLP